MSAEVSVLVVDDQEPFRLVAAAVVQATDGFRHAGSAATGEDAVAVFADGVGSDVPDLVLMDVNLPGIDGFEATRLIRALAPAARIVMISTYQEREYGDRAIESGADGFLDKAEFSPAALESMWRRIPNVGG